MDYVVAVDLDGVLADFDGRIKEIFNGQTPNKKELWTEVRKYDSQTQPFFETLPKMRDADDLVTTIGATFPQMFILTAVGTCPKNADEQKRRWVKNHYGGIPVFTVVKGTDKALYARPNVILVDDNLSVVENFVAAGGKGVHHVDVKTSLQKLKAFC